MKKVAAVVSAGALVLGLGLFTTSAEADPPTVPQAVGWDVVRNSEEASPTDGGYAATATATCEEGEIAVGGAYHYDYTGLAHAYELEMSTPEARFGSFSYLWNGEGLPEAYTVTLNANADGELFVDVMCAEGP